ncbi:C2H2-type zinc-finger protein [Rhizoctonia solani AG-3 Rhs1AP]|uniref:C2H2-type zinc-finger protein n=1 Tax=Rhizoctonia solani AG-3 Rhs1AP TaxID=1086054 RepID=A0A0A1UJ25_9AGAM|nr:C2H2-type zinc-finger protein [Rhizoctonia solani AG-3 Rhs1AP]
MTEDVPPRGRASHSLAVYHVPDTSLAPSEGLIAPSSTCTTRNSPVSPDRVSLASLYPYHPPTSSGEESVAKPITRRVMYDPVRDSVASSSPGASPSHTAPIVGQPTLEGNTPKPVYPDISVTLTPLFDPAIDVRHSPHSEDDSLIRARIIRRYPQHPYDSLTTADQGSRLQYAQYARPLETHRTDGSSAVYRTPADTELGTVLQGPHNKYALSSSSRTTVGSTNNKRRYAALEDTSEDRPIKAFSRDVNESVYADIKGKGKATVSQSPAFRLDNLLGPAAPGSPQTQPAGSDGSSERSPSETRTTETPYVFTGRLPPPPYTGHSGAPSSSYPSIGVMGISVSSDVDLGRFAVPDDFERAVISAPGPITNAMRSSMPSASHASSSDPNVKLARKHTTTQRRKARGLFPQDNVPLAISTTTTKQSRYRPSGDRQPVACGYKDPTTGVQCDEPFNRSVELRRHVRAVHVPAEALAVTVGQLSRSQATLLPADWKPGDGDVLRPKCVCGKEFSRLDALRRHWTGVNAEVKDGKCISCPSSISRKKDHAVYEGTESTFGAPVYS